MQRYTFFLKYLWEWEKSCTFAAVFSYRIKHLTEHLKENHKDFGTARALTKMVGRRRKLLKYLYNKDINRYRELIKALGLRK